jgi:hypothetical protein
MFASELIKPIVRLYTDRNTKISSSMPKTVQEQKKKYKKEPFIAPFPKTI